MVDLTNMQRHKPDDGNDEHAIQCSCIRWMHLQHRGLLIFAIPNGGARTSLTGSRLRDEGVMKGVADLFLAEARCGLHGLFIEMKTRHGAQRDTQKRFEQLVIERGYGYVICRSLDQFIKTIEKYIGGNL